MTEFEELEDLLRSSRLPDTNFKKFRRKTWQRIIERKRKKRRALRLVFLKSYWVWTLASLLVLAICLVLMYSLTDLL